MKKARRKRTKINIGDKFNRLTILKFTGNQNSHRTFDALCECGTITRVKGTHLVQGNIKSCGCLWLEQITKEKGLAGFKNRYQQYKGHSKKIGREFQLTFEDFKSFVTQNCYYCKNEPKDFNVYLNVDGTKRYKYSKEHGIGRAWIKLNGIDRIDSSLGYIKDNCRPCCITCNTMKMDIKESDFINHISKIFKHLELK